MYRRTISADPMDLAAKSKFIATEIVREMIVGMTVGPRIPVRLVLANMEHILPHMAKRWGYLTVAERGIFTRQRANSNITNKPQRVITY